jgi:hypothetical protein
MRTSPDQIHVCYSPEGERVEATRANFHDLTSFYGYTTNAPLGVEVPYEEGGPKVAPTGDAGIAAEAAAAEADAELEAPTTERVPNEFDNMEKPELVEFLKEFFPEAAFDGRANRDTLAELAATLSAESTAASAA